MHGIAADFGTAAIGQLASRANGAADRSVWLNERRGDEMIELTKTITRQLPNGAVVEFGPEGIRLRRYKGRGVLVGANRGP